MHLAFLTLTDTEHSRHSQ